MCAVCSVFLLRFGNELSLHESHCATGCISKMIASMEKTIFIWFFYSVKSISSVEAQIGRNKKFTIEVALGMAEYVFRSVELHLRCIHEAQIDSAIFFQLNSDSFKCETFKHSKIRLEMDKFYFYGTVFFSFRSAATLGGSLHSPYQETSPRSPRAPIQMRLFSVEM